MLFNDTGYHINLWFYCYVFGAVRFGWSAASFSSFSGERERPEKKILIHCTLRAWVVQDETHSSNFLISPKKWNWTLPLRYWPSTKWNVPQQEMMLLHRDVLTSIWYQFCLFARKICVKGAKLTDKNGNFNPKQSMSAFLPTFDLWTVLLFRMQVRRPLPVNNLRGRFYLVRLISRPPFNCWLFSAAKKRKQFARSIISSFHPRVLEQLNVLLLRRKKKSSDRCGAARSTSLTANAI